MIVLRSAAVSSEPRRSRHCHPSPIKAIFFGWAATIVLAAAAIAILDVQ